MAQPRILSPTDWRPQSFGSRGFRDVSDPLIEPLWTGLRVLAHAAPGGARLIDGDGAELGYDAIREAIGAALLAGEAVLDGYLSPEAAQSGEGIFSGPPIEAPSAGQMARQMVMGGGRDRRREILSVVEGEPTPPAEDEVAFVAVDLLSIDGQPLLDIPLLERKRLLESALAETDLVRCTIHVRPPIDTWLSTWRASGFRALAYKAANSRYRPGERNDGWATIAIPTR